MRRRRVRIAVSLLPLLWATTTFAGDVPRVFTCDPQAVARLREQFHSEKADSPALQQLRAEGERALKQPAISVTQKDANPPSGDKHDYMSLAPYWWPNPNTPNGLPYIRRDGERNPEIARLQDHNHFDAVMAASYSLALAFYVTSDERYATHAADLLRTWFLEPATRMNPNLQFAQAVPGVNTGRGTGLIETRGIGRVVDAVGLLAGSHAWTAADQEGMTKWFSDFLDWMRNSQNGRAESAAKNNHGTWYDAQIAVLALAVGRTDVAREVLEGAKTKRLDRQIAPDGSQSFELVRTKSWGYSVMNLAGLFQLARLGDRVGVDLWRYRGAKGQSILASLDYLVPYATGDKRWTATQIEPLNPRAVVPLLLDAADHYHDARYRQLAVKLDPGIAETLTAALAR